MNYEIKKIKPFGVIVQVLKENINVKDIPILELKDLFTKEHLIVLRGFQTFPDSERFVNYCDLWGEVSVWPFGKVLELVEHEKPEDHIFDSSYVPLHWDGMYRKQVPEYQIFHCLKAPLEEKGGRTTFSNTVLALKNSGDEKRKQWSKVIGSYEREMEFYNSKTVSPIITKHPYKDYSVIRYNEPSSSNESFVNPPNLNFLGLDSSEIQEFHQNLSKALYDEKNFYAHKWIDGDVVIADNFTLLHGREKFVSKSPRHIRRVQVLSDPPFNNPGLESYQ